MKISLADTEATLRLGITLGESLTPGSVILLEGDLGTGKTTLVQGIGKGLGITEPIVSPTFTLINEYTEGRIPLYHLDLYRLEPQEVPTLNLEIYWEGVEVTPGIVAIEWAERMPYKPDSFLSINLTYGNEGDVYDGLRLRQVELIPFHCSIDKIIAAIYSRIQNSRHEL
ncbi:tRNA (adenosine(37)-N6)-threonylcarbamoyltransferase complex ATPase subunit type 1 TsaE [Nostoc sp. C117]|uniref:tRNA (adenosine(37)-N6)-threonylcarbamoyltransferase complex ATPase subunit type 1 TsaE n=1 Tax=Nostoc sp. C117 TaxID=3349875 RepID=UPI00370D0D8A